MAFPGIPRHLLFALSVSCLVAVVSPAPAQAEGVFKVIVNAANPADQLKRAQVALLFTNRSARWSWGQEGAPVDQSTRSAVREAFSTEVLQQSILAVQNQWMRRITESHETPPPVKASDDDVIAYVEKNKAGIGYVSAAANLPSTVKVLRIAE